MQVSELKEYLLNNDLVENVLAALGCNHIQNRGEYISAANPDGDNKQAIIVYLGDNLNCIDYTRTISQTKSTTDIFDLISYFNDCTFAESLKWTCDTIGLDYYKEPEELPESLQLIKILQQMSSDCDEENEKPLKPISEKVLSYYIPCGNVMLEDDNISLETQSEFEIAYDPHTNSICFPIRDEIGTLIAVKARRFKYTSGTPLSKRKFNKELRDGECKYFFLEPGAKSQILYGLYKNAKYIQRQGIVFVGESEKFTLQLYDMGYYGVSTGGSKVSKRQIEMLTRLGVKICFCFDKDITEADLRNISNGFMDGVPVYAVIDKENILDEKESPSDDTEKWLHLITNHIYRIK